MRNLPSLFRGSFGFRDLSNVHREINRLFNEILPPEVEYVGEYEMVPFSDIEESDNEYFVSMDLPGVDRDRINIEVNQNQLFVSAERREERRDKERRGRAYERSYGRYQRSFTLPTSIDQNKIQAHYSDGVLELVLPKSEAAKPKRISIQSGPLQRRLGAKGAEREEEKKGKREVERV